MGLVSEFRRRISRLGVYGLVKRLTLHNRIQGSRGLVEAGEDLEALLLESMPDNVDVELIYYSGKGVPDWMPTPIGWDLSEAIVRVDGREASSRSHPVLASPHTPPTDGWIKGRLRFISDPLNPEEYRGSEGEVLAVGGHYRVAYRLAEEAGAEAILFYREDLPPGAGPYIGLFLQPGEDHRLPAASVPRGLIEGRNGSMVELYIDADVRDDPRFPVLVAWTGDRDSVGPLIAAHYCHPTPGANDNASGVAAAVEAFRLLVEMDEGYTVRLALFPEYTGSTAVAEGWLAEKTSVMVNLDMVGGRVEQGLGPLTLYHPAWGIGARLPGIIEDVARMAGFDGIAVRTSYYSGGSDHDVFLAYGIPSVMVNQWPDPYYHSDYDDAYRIDPEVLRTSAAIGAVIAYLSATKYTPHSSEPRVSMIMSSHESRGSRKSVALASEVLAGKPGGSGWIPVDDERIIKPLASFLPDYTLRGLELGDIARLARLVSPLWNAYARDLFYQSRGGVTVKALHSKLAAIYGVDLISGDRLLEVLEVYERAGLVEIG